MMSKHIRLFLSFIWLLILAVGCGRTTEIVDKLELIKKAGDTDPESALLMLDSLDIPVRDESDYVQMKYDLLSLRLHDKADDRPSSDITARRVVSYFEAEGSAAECQEAYYYAGSVYRDLQDTPRALDYFYKSADVALEHEDIDSLMLRNTYSQLSFLLWSVQDYSKANQYALKEYELSEMLTQPSINAMMHAGVSYQYLHNPVEAKKWLDKAYVLLLRDDSITDVETLYCLIYNYSQLKDYDKARKCYDLSLKLPENSRYASKDLCLGTYYEFTNQPDSAIICYKRIVEGSPDLFSVVDAYKCLFNIYYWAGKDKEALYYANKYRETGDSLDLGKRQELAATVNNQYKYHLDREKEFRLNEERDRLRYTITIISITSVMAAVLLGLLLIVRKNRGLREKLALIKEIDARRLRQEELQEEIRKREGELETSRQHLDHVQGKLDALQERLSRTTREAEDLEKELRDKERQLSDRTAQNRLLIGLLHESKLEDKAEDVIQSIRQTSKGMKNMTAASWRQLYQAVDELHPKFRDQLSAQFGKLNDQQLKVCYLMKIGLSNLQIRNMTNLSRVTVWRWVKKYNWILFPPES